MLKYVFKTRVKKSKNIDVVLKKMIKKNELIIFN